MLDDAVELAAAVVKAEDLELEAEELRELNARLEAGPSTAPSALIVG